MAKKTKEQKKEALEIAKKEERIKKENKTLRNIIIGIIILVAVILLVVFISGSAGSFMYQGVKFDTVKFCDSGPCLVLYKTSLPVRVTNGTNPILVMPSQKTNDFNFYLRNDPRNLNVIFNGSLTLQKNMVFNSNGSFSCNGNGGIAGANFVQLYSILGINVIKDENATCDPFGRYTYVMVQPGNETSIEQFGPSCYYINIKGCEVLEGTEKFMIQTFVKVNSVLNNQSA